MKLQFFAEKKNNIKALNEKRAEKVKELESLYKKLNTENRAITEEEEQQVQDISDEIENIDKTIKILNDVKERLAKSDKKKGNPEGEEGQEETRAEDSEAEKEFADFLRGTVAENRAANLTFGDNGAVVPKTIANKIIKKVYDICPILEKSTRYNVRGTLSIPFYPVDGSDITVGYHDEFTELTSSTGKFGSIDLKGFLVGALTLVSKSLVNNSQFDIVSFVVDHMAYSIARFVEGELLKGSGAKIDGISKVKNIVTAKANSAITADELIDLQGMVKDAFQQNAVWIMSSKTRTALRKLKDQNGRYLLQDDTTSAFGNTLLGKQVYVSDNMEDIGASKTVIYYGDMSGLAVKITEEMEVQVLREKYATQHAVGVVAWMELDAKIENEQKIAALKMGA